MAGHLLIAQKKSLPNLILKRLTEKNLRVRQNKTDQF